METIDADVPCVKCGYNLRTLPGDGVCSECGEPIAATVAAAALRLAPYGRLRALSPTTLAKTRDAVTLAIVAWFAGLPLAVPMLTMPSGVSQAAHGAARLLPFVGCYVLSAWAAWHLAIAGRDRGALTSRLMRGVIVVGVTALGLIFLNSRWADYYVSGLPHARYDRTLGRLRLIGRVGTIAWPISTVWATARLMRLASTARRPGAAVVFGVTCALGTFLAGLLSLGTLLGDIDRAGSGEMMPYLIGPTGSAPAVWYVAAAVAHPSLFAKPGGWIFFLLIVVVSAMSTALLRLRGAITRAIALGKLPAASSRSSLSPRPPA